MLNTLEIKHQDQYFDILINGDKFAQSYPIVVV
jgi:hypothetical protein